MKIQHIVQEIIDVETKTISLLKNSIDEILFDALSYIKSSKGRLIVTGVGKSALVGQKIVATFNSTGTAAIFMHAADAMHGDLGMIQPEDTLLFISKSGETMELRRLLDFVKKLDNKIIAFVSKKDSYLGSKADFLIHIPVPKEADPFDLIPSSSSLAQIAMGDVFAIALLQMRGFTKEHFAKFHPGGMIGKQLLLKVSDLASKNEIPSIMIEDSVQDAIGEITKKRLGATAVLNDQELVGIITDGDLRRMLTKGIAITAKAEDVMTPSPKVIESSTLVADALTIMKKHNINQLLVVAHGKYEGMIHLHDILKEGFA